MIRTRGSAGGNFEKIRKLIGQRVRRIRLSSDRLPGGKQRRRAAIGAHHDKNDIDALTARLVPAQKSISHPTDGSTVQR